MTPHDLIAAFDAVAEAPEGVARLRELVLQLAVRGKLVPQDPTDQPAGALLERIAAEKARRVKAGKIVKRPVLEQVVPHEQPFEIPESWAWARLNEIAHSLGQGIPARTTRDATRAATRDSMLDALRAADTPDEVEVAWNRFSERMEDLLDDPADIGPLRQTILDLAVHGKLVPQDRNDEAVRLPPLRRFAAASGMDYGVFEQFRDSIRLPSGWEIAPLARLSEHIVDCPHTTPKWTNDGEICVRTNQLRPRSLDLSEPRRRLIVDLYKTVGEFAGGAFQNLPSSEASFLSPGTRADPEAIAIRRPPASATREAHQADLGLHRHRVRWPSTPARDVLFCGPARREPSHVPIVRLEIGQAMVDRLLSDS